MNYSKKSKIITLLSIFLPLIGWGQYFSVQNGNWTDPATWSTGTVPPGWGNHTVVINHQVTLNTSPAANSWNITVNAGASLIETGCQMVQAWSAGSVWTNHGTISCFQMDSPGQVDNFGTMNINLLQTAYDNATWVNHPGGVINCSQAQFSNNADLFNHGTFNITGTITPCMSGIAPFRFNHSGDTLINTGIINSYDFHTANIYVHSATGAQMNIADIFDLNGSVFQNYGSIDLGGVMKINSSQFENYYHINIDSSLENNGGSFFYNYGCECNSEDGVITIQKKLFNSNYLENNGLIHVLGDTVENYHQIGTTTCGFLNATSDGTIFSYTGDQIFGPLRVCGTAVCWGCTIDPQVVFDCQSSPTICQSILSAESLLLSGKSQGGSALLEWKMPQTQFSKVEIEQAGPDSEFSTIGQMNCEPGNSYQQLAPMRGHEEHFFRLKAQSNDGQFHYSNTVALSPQNSTGISVFPNPLVGEYLTVSGVDAETGSLRITDLSGRLVQAELEYQSGGEVLVRMPQLGAGVYFLRYSGGGFSETLLFVKW